MQGLDPSKAHGQDTNSIRMVKICGNPICKPLETIYEECLRLSLFPLERKKRDIVPI